MQNIQLIEKKELDIGYFGGELIKKFKGFNHGWRS